MLRVPLLQHSAATRWRRHLQSDARSSRYRTGVHNLPLFARRRTDVSFVMPKKTLVLSGILYLGYLFQPLLHGS